MKGKEEGETKEKRRNQKEREKEIREAGRKNSLVAQPTFVNID